ncbi:hypothetical protein [Tautonia rosea]|uniref:hypothetical protein n=1 Tax=Tautonia rosea TaxID=2728037 RepID=UPI001475B318|nr:hypothetical protein [Tautonia rosea]
MRHACLVVCSWLGALSLSVTAQDSPSRELYRAPVFNGGDPIVREISEDGLYVAHTARQVIRNNQGDVQLSGQTLDEKIPGTTWSAATIQAVQRTRDGSFAVVVSQLLNDRKNESPFNKELPAFESLLYDAPPEVVVRFPAEVRGTIPAITTSFFGAPHTLRLMAGNRSKHRLGDIDLQAPKAPEQSLPIRNTLDHWTDPFNRIVLGNGTSYLDGSLRLVNLTGRGPESVPLDFINKVPSRFSKGPGRISPGLDDQSLLVHYQEGLILWSLAGQQRATFPYDPAVIPPNRTYSVALLSGDRALLMERDGDLFLIDLNAGALLARHHVDAILTEPGIQYVAGSGTYVCMRTANKQEYRAMCLKIDGDTIQGPWWVPDPETGRPLTPVTNLNAARRAPTLAVETAGQLTSRMTPEERQRSLPRILLVDLDHLTRAAPAEAEDPAVPFPRGRSSQ